MGAGLERQGEARQDRAAIAVDHHLDHGREAARPEVVGLLGARRMAEAQRLIAQAVPLLQQQQPLSGQILLIDRGPAGERMIPGDREVEGVVEQRPSGDGVPPDRQGHDQQIELTREQRVQQLLGLTLAQREPQVGVGGVQPRQHLRQQIRADRRNDSEPERPGEHPVAMAREIGQILDREQDLARPPCDFLAGSGQEHAARGPLDQDHAEQRLELPYLHAHRRLGDLAAVGGAAEVQRLGERCEIAELLQRRRHPPGSFLDHCRGGGARPPESLIV